MANFKAVLAGSGGKTDWADDVEETERAQGTPLVNQSDFPSLGEAAKQPLPSKKAAKGKGQKMSLADFVGAKATPSGGLFADKALNEKAILAQLPTASRGVPREDVGRPGLGGAFYARDGDRPGFSRDDRGPRRDDDMGPSRADMNADWGATRTFTPSAGGPRPGGFGGGFSRDRDGGGFPPREPREFRPSAADETDNWGREKKYEPAGPSRGGFDDRRPGGGFRDGPGPAGDGERRNAYEPSRADVEDQWNRGRDFKPSSNSPSSLSRNRPPGAEDREDRWLRKPGSDEPQPSAASSGGAPPSGPSERPRLQLKPRTAPVDQPSTSSTGGAPKSSVFGDARPREDVLKEKGVDPIKEQLKLEHGDVKRAETPEEKAMKEEVEALRKQLEDLKASSDGGGEEQVKEAQAALDDKEKALFKLQAELDDRVRFKQQDRERSRERDGAAPPPPRPRW